MRFIFWAAVGVVSYTYLGYLTYLWILSRRRRRPVRSSSYFPQVSIVLVARNEIDWIERKLRNLMSLNYPADKIQIIVVSDGSTDGTNQAVSEFADGLRVKFVAQGERQGKASGLISALKFATGEVVVFTDARQAVANDAILYLMENFADPSVGCASGELMLGDPVSGESVRGMGLYWKIEKLTRELESATGSVVGATGALYAVRRDLLPPLSPRVILDDVSIPMQVARRGFRVVFDSRAKIWDVPDLGTRREFDRKVRTLSGVYQLLEMEPWLLTRSNPLRFEFVSHKLLRLLVPFALCAMLITSLLVPTAIYRSALILQLAFYGLSFWGFLKLKWSPLAKMADAAFTFVLLNAAAAVAFAAFVSGRRPAWGR